LQPEWGAGSMAVRAPFHWLARNWQAFANMFSTLIRGHVELMLLSLNYPSRILRLLMSQYRH
jgi:hypothetical protein